MNDVNAVELGVFVFFFLLVTVMGFMAARWRRAGALDSLDEWGLGGRGFGTTCGHFYDNWRNADFRRFVLNALVWTAGVEIPETGVEARFYDHDEIMSELDRLTGRAALPESCTC